LLLVEWHGFVFDAVTPLDQGRETGAGFLRGPDGSKAGLQWELAESPYIMRIEGPSEGSWGLYRVGFTQPVATAADVAANLGPLWPKLRVLYERIRGVH
jgi:hypothetical protein